jgi:DNA polymerase III alpha subunit
MQNLIRCGAFDSFELTRPELLWRLEFLFHSGHRKDSGSSADRDSLFPSGHDLSPARHVVPRLPEYPRIECLRIEREIFGFTVSEHPLALYEAALAAMPGLVSARDIPSHEGRRVRIVGRPIAHKRIATEKSGAMMFLSLDDLTGPFEVVIFPDCYRRYGALALSEGPFIVTGRVTGEYGVFTVICERIELLRHQVALQARPKGAEQGVSFAGVSKAALSAGR